MIIYMLINVMYTYIGTLLNEMSRITISKIIAGIVVMLIALNYVGHIQISYTTTIAATDRATELYQYYKLINITDSRTMSDHDMHNIHQLSTSFTEQFSSCYYFSYLNKTKYVLSNYTEVEYIVVLDDTTTSVYNNIQVRIPADLSILVIPSYGVVLDNSIFNYNNSDHTVSRYDDDYIQISHYDSIHTRPILAAFIIKLNLYQESIDISNGSIQVSLFMIGLILFWYMLYNHQAEGLSNKICKPMQQMM